MDHNRFDGLTRGLATGQSRRAALKGLLGGVLGLSVAGRTVEMAGAGNPPTITIHARVCRTAEGDPYRMCHDNPKRGATFRIVSRYNVPENRVVAEVKTGLSGNAPTVTAKAGRMRVRQLTPEPSFWQHIWVTCTDTESGFRLFDEAANSGNVTFRVRGGMRVVCDWYGYRVPAEQTTTTTTTTASPCGLFDYPCCPGNTCDANLACVNDKCAPTCGVYAYPCCPGNTCVGDFVCTNGTCYPAP